MKMFYVVEEHFVKVNDTDSRLVDYTIKEAFADFMEAAKYVEDIFINKNRRNQWTACAGGQDDIPVHSIRKANDNESYRIYVKQ
jgi:hypothetical protein